MGKDNVTRFPVLSHERWRNRFGQRAVPCQVSDRWLQFPENSAIMNNDKCIFVDVMTLSSDGGKHRKLTSLCLSKKELLSALERVK